MTLFDQIIIKLSTYSKINFQHSRSLLFACIHAGGLAASTYTLALVQNFTSVSKKANLAVLVIAGCSTITWLFLNLIYPKISERLEQ